MTSGDGRPTWTMIRPIVRCDGIQKTSATAKHGRKATRGGGAPNRDNNPRDDRNSRDDHNSRDDNGRTFERESERTRRHRDGQPDEPRWQGRAGENERGGRRRHRKRRFHEREAEASQPQFVPGDDAADDGDRRERERSDEAQSAARERERESRRLSNAPPADRSHDIDDRPRPDPRPHDPPKKWDAEAEWRHATRASAPSGDPRPPARETYDRHDRDDLQRAQEQYAAQQEESRRLREQEESRRLREQEESRRLREQEESRRLREQQESRRLREQEDSRRLREQEEPPLGASNKRALNVSAASGSFLNVPRPKRSRNSGGKA
jgi:hypothetical protein